MQKHETYQRACQCVFPNTFPLEDGVCLLTSSSNREIHGFEGPIKVSFGNYTYPIKDDFLRAAESQGIPIVDDLQDLTTGHGAEQWLKWINRDTGSFSRSSMAILPWHKRFKPLLINSSSFQVAEVTALMPTFTPLGLSTAIFTCCATPR